MDGLLIGSGSLLAPPDAMSEALDCDLKFTSVADDDDLWYAYSGPVVEYYLNGDSVRTDDTLADSSEAWLQTIVESDSAETVKFYWKVSSEEGGDYLQFYIDSTLKDQISGEVDWQQKSYSVTAGTHTLKWRYVKNGSVSSGENRAWVDFVQWTGPSPAQDLSNWQQIAYKDDVAGRRVEKKVDGYSTRYVHDGGHVIAEYDGNNNLLRKYIYGPGIDQPVCMIEVADANAVYYYHFDALGSVVALSDAAGDTVQTYEYSVYGEVAVEDANHPNPYMFAGVRYDIEIGLYYNRARYYNPFTGRFLQTDPAFQTTNLYAYCGNNPANYIDPSGAIYYGILDMDHERATPGMVTLALFNDDGTIARTRTFSDLDNMIAHMKPKGIDSAGEFSSLADGNEDVYWDIITVIWLNYKERDYASKLDKWQKNGGKVYQADPNDPYDRSRCEGTSVFYKGEWLYGNGRGWDRAPAWAALAHEMHHQLARYDDIPLNESDWGAMNAENVIRYALYTKVPNFAEGGAEQVWARPAYGSFLTSNSQYHRDISWKEYWDAKPWIYPDRDLFR